MKLQLEAKKYKISKKNVEEKCEFYLFAHMAASGGDIRLRIEGGGFEDFEFITESEFLLIKIRQISLAWEWTEIHHFDLLPLIINFASSAAESNNSKLRREMRIEEQKLKECFCEANIKNEITRFAREFFSRRCHLELCRRLYFYHMIITLISKKKKKRHIFKKLIIF